MFAAKMPLIVLDAEDKGQARRRSNVVQQMQACDEWEEDGRDPERAAAMQARGTAVDKAVDKKRHQDEVPDFLCKFSAACDLSAENWPKI